MKSCVRTPVRMRVCKHAASQAGLVSLWPRSVVTVNAVARFQNPLRRISRRLIHMRLTGSQEKECGALPLCKHTGLLMSAPPPGLLGIATGKRTHGDLRHSVLNTLQIFKLLPSVGRGGGGVSVPGGPRGISEGQATF